MEIRKIQTVQDIEKTYECLLELRPHLANRDAFVTQVQAQMEEGYKILSFFHEEEAVACIGYRFFTMLAWGKVLYIDDLITKKDFRGKKFGDLLLKNVIEIAQNSGCDEVHLDSGYARHAAHFVYLRNGFELKSHHFALKINK